LDRLMARHPHRATVYAVFMRPPHVAPGWERTDLWRHAQSIPGVQAVVDDRGVYLRDFCVSASGETVLYGADHRLQFHGGITAGRGKYGDNAGQFAVADLLRQKPPHAQCTPVFGCALKNQRAAGEVGP
jgi:hypothetical protein